MIKVAMVGEFPYLPGDLYRGGVMQANYRLVKALAECKDVELAVLVPTQHVKSVEIQRINHASIVFCPQPRRDSLLLFRQLRHALDNLLSNFRPDLVHAQGFPPYIFAALRTNRISIITVHGVFRDEYRVFRSRRSVKDRLMRYYLSRLEAYNFSRINNLIAITSQIERLVRRSSPQVRVFRIDNPIDDRFFSLGDEHSKATVLFVGWISFRKGLHLLLEAVEELALGISDLEVRIAGVEDMDPTYGPALRKKYAGLIRSGRVVFLGGITQEELYREMSRCAVLCLPSLAESAPMVIAQSMAAGKPVVASRVGGIPDMVEDGIAGRLFNPGNVSDLAGCLGELLLNREERLLMGRRARGLALARYKPESVARKTIEAYFNVLETERKPA
jgi:glycosyltransferase involved in cell wall biosynthesis